MVGDTATVDHEGYEVELDRSEDNRLHPWESTGRTYSGLKIFRRVRKAPRELLSLQQQELLGLDPLILVPVDAQAWRGKLCHRVTVSGPLPPKPRVHFGRGVWGIECRLSEVPEQTQVTIFDVEPPPKTRLIVGAALGKHLNNKHYHRSRTAVNR
jgi:hypothetical protein